jgi:hypothetical protein
MQNWYPDGMKLQPGLFLLSGLLCGGCLSQYKELANRKGPDTLPQLVRIYHVQQVLLKPTFLFISGQGSAAADGGKTQLNKSNPLSSYPAIELTINRGNTGDLEDCLQRIHEAQSSKATIDFRGMGTFTIKSVIDPPLNTGIFTLTKLDACGSAIFFSSTTSAAISTTTTQNSQAATPVSDLVAVPERYFDHKTVITGNLPSPVQFMETISHLVLESDGQSLQGYFQTPTLPAETRLALVHAAPGSKLTLEGTLTHTNPTSLAAQSGSTATSGYEFDISNVISIESATH